MQDRIEKSIELKADVARVWRALTDPAEFGAWFGVELDGPFAAGEVSTGRVTHPGYEHLPWRVEVQVMEPERLLSFRWHPNAVEPDADYSKEPATLVEFTLQSIPGGTRLRIVESGFAALPPGPRGRDAFRENSRGWEIQVNNIRAHVER